MKQSLQMVPFGDDKKNNELRGRYVRFRVRKDLCAGCGLCVESCRRRAIVLESGQAQIDQARCNGCGNCLDVCPRGAIVRLVPVSKYDLATTVSSLKQKTDDLLTRIEKLRQQHNIESRK
jgi:formate hydrogenlyase subunit 6/NADH:ubiquinone oxidoreductase subunit I